MTIKSCPICLFEGLLCKGVINGYKRPSEFQVLACKHCEVSFAAPLKSDDAIYDKIYSQVDMVPGYARYAHFVNEIAKKSDPLDYLKYEEDCYFGVIDFVQSNLKDYSSLIIEIGCGQGYLTYALRKLGYNAVGLDLSKESIDIAKSKFGDFYHCMSLEGFIRSTGERPLFIICTELIEHLVEPVAFVDEMLSNCDPRGGLVLSTPNKHKYEKSVWNTELPPVHLWWFGIKSLEYIAKRVGAEMYVISADGFYKKKPYKPSRSTESDQVRLPIFDENYQLINPIKKKSNLRLFLRKAEILIKSFLMIFYKSSDVKQIKYCSGDADEQLLTHSLCCFYFRSK